MNSPLQNKLLQYEVQPPHGVWANIAASLDDGISLVVSEKLYQYEEDPSSAVWQNIEAKLGNPSEKAKVIPFYVRYRRPLKYSGAVAIFAFFAVLTSLLFSKRTESEVPPPTVANTSTGKTDTANTPIKEENDSVTQPTQNNKSDRLIAKTKASRPQREDTQTSFAFNEDFLPRQAERNEIVNASLFPDKYMIYSDGDGNVIRLPKKIFSAFACPTDDLICKQRLQHLREKFAASAMTADFNGLLQILKSLQENQ